MRLYRAFCLIIMGCFVMPLVVFGANNQDVAWIGITPINYDYSGERLEAQWPLLHSEDCLPFPTVTELVTRLSNNKQLKMKTEQGLRNFIKQQQLFNISHDKALALYLEDITLRLMEGFRLYHMGQFEKAYKVGDELGYFGHYLKGHALYANAYFLTKNQRAREKQLWRVVNIMTAAEKIEPDNASFKFLHIYALGRLLEQYDFSFSLMADYKIINTFSNQLIEQAFDHLGAQLVNAAFIAQGSIKAPFIAKWTFGATKKQAVKQFEGLLSQHPDTIPGHYTYLENLMGMKRLPDRQLDLCKKIQLMEPHDINGDFYQSLARQRCKANSMH